jgi:hypothetical protein
MRPLHSRVQLLLLLSLGLLALGLPGGSVGAPSDLAPPDLSVPQLLAPAAGKVFPRGSPIVFRIRTHPGDERLFLLISKSPTAADACGTIGSDVTSANIGPTSDPSIYEADTPYYDYESFWMNQPGTYYWQVHRVEYREGGDGCIESETRALTIKPGALPATTTRTATPTPAPKPKPTPTPKQAKPPRALSVARLAGDFDVRTRVTSVVNWDAKPGETETGTWTFTPLCSSGACQVRLSISFGLVVAERTVRMRLVRSGTAYNGSGRATIAQCSFKDVVANLSIRLRVAKGAWIDSVWRATKVVGTYALSAPETTSGIYRCRAGSAVKAVTGTLAPEV